MFSFFAPAYIKEAELVLKNARKLLHYKKDLLPAGDRVEFEAALQRLDAAIRARDRGAVEATAKQLDEQWSKYLPPVADAGWRENCEVFLVAIVIAIGVRSYFLQPFTIPTGSMQPTLNGIIGTPTTAAPPNLAVQAFDMVMRGRNYVNVIATSDDNVVRMTERHMLYFFTLTDVQCEHSSYTVWAPMDTLMTYFNVWPEGAFQHPPTHLTAGQPVARGYVDAGDHVFVDKVSYNLHMPRRGTVFVFSTLNIEGIQRTIRDPSVTSEFFIKRLVGLPGDTLRVEQPKLYINGGLATEFGMQRVMSMAGDYRGYENIASLSTPDDSVSVPPHHYFAMGDNSFNSLDSRYWGAVPEENLMGRGLFVYWPFLPHWGLVK